MAIPKLIKSSKGSWEGKSRLNQSWLPPEKRIAESKSKFHVDTDAHDTFATITYLWSHEGKSHEGQILLCEGDKSKKVQLGWVDSWHQNTAVMHLAGEEAADGSVKAKGTYDAEGETWGWTIAFHLTADTLTMKMENLTPKDEAEWAVEAVYHRAK